VRAFLTGGTGFIGGWTAERLVADGWEVAALVRRSSDTSLLRNLGTEIVTGDVLDPAAVHEGMRGADAVVHVAGLFRLGHPDAALVYRTNVEGTLNILEAARREEVGRTLHVSSAGVLGPTDEPATEFGLRTGAFSGSYEWSKYQAHLEAVRRGMRGEPVVIAMPGGVFGPRDTGLLGWLLSRLVAGRLLASEGTGTKFTLVHVEDVVDGMMRILRDGIPGTGYILGDEVTSIQGFLERAAAMTEQKPPRTVGMGTLRFVRPLSGLRARLTRTIPRVSKETLALLAAGDQVYDADLARRHLDWSPRPFMDRLRDTVAWYRDH
jgi:dihydroflavonol-4-reductase